MKDNKQVVDEVLIGKILNEMFDDKYRRHGIFINEHDLVLNFAIHFNSLTNNTFDLFAENRYPDLGYKLDLLLIDKSTDLKIAIEFKNICYALKTYQDRDILLLESVYPCFSLREIEHDVEKLSQLQSKHKVDVFQVTITNFPFEKKECELIASKYAFDMKDFTLKVLENDEFLTHDNPNDEDLDRISNSYLINIVDTFKRIESYDKKYKNIINEIDSKFPVGTTDRDNLNNDILYKDPEQIIESWPELKGLKISFIKYFKELSSKTEPQHRYNVFKALVFKKNIS